MSIDRTSRPEVLSFSFSVGMGMQPYRTIVTIGNHDPVADPNGPYEASVCQEIQLDGSASYDPDQPTGDYIASYQWDLDNDGFYDDATGIQVPFNQCAPGYYTVRLKVTDSLGSTGTAQTSVTVSAKTPPVVTTDDATNVATTLATLNGDLTSLGTASSVTVSFEWGLTTSYGNVSTPEAMTSQGAFSISLTGLSPCTTYHFRAKAVGDGTIYGEDRSFTTACTPPSVTTDDATSIGSGSATLNGDLTGLGTASSVVVSFQWGTSSGSYTSETASRSMTSSGAFSADLNGLTPGTTYYYRAKAVGDGTVYGVEKTFTTTTAGPVSATIDFDPDTLNLGSQGKVVTVYIELPTGYNVSQIDVSGIRLNGTLPALAKPTAIGDYDKDGIPDLMVKFDRASLEKVLTPGDQVQITIRGKVAGIDFEGSDTIRVIAKGKLSTAGSSYLGYAMAGFLGCFVIAAGLLTFFQWGRPLPRRD